MIEPTIGRRVWFHATPAFGMPHPLGYQPEAATVVYVHGPRMVNLQVIDHFGLPRAVLSCQLFQDGDMDPVGPYAEWMPYQKGQAAKSAEVPSERMQAGIDATVEVIGKRRQFEVTEGRKPKPTDDHD